MFTKFIDESVAHYTLADGTEIAFAYDQDAPDPVIDCAYPIGIERDECNATATDPTGVLEEYDRLADELDDLELIIAEMHKDHGSETIDKAIACELDDIPFDERELQALKRIKDARDEFKAITYLEWQNREEPGWPSYRIAYREADLIKDGRDSEMLDEIVKGMAREYSMWECGSVYLMGIQAPGEEVEYYSVFAGFNPFNEEEVRAWVIGDHGNADGLTLVTAEL